jgi:hypothetical protein
MNACSDVRKAGNPSLYYTRGTVLELILSFRLI